jgi:hypothetical protein
MLFTTGSHQAVIGQTAGTVSVEPPFSSSWAPLSIVVTKLLILISFKFNFLFFMVKVLGEGQISIFNLPVASKEKLPGSPAL